MRDRANRGAGEKRGISGDRFEQQIVDRRFLFVREDKGFGRREKEGVVMEQAGVTATGSKIRLTGRVRDGRLSMRTKQQ